MHTLPSFRRSGVALASVAALLMGGLAPGAANAHTGGTETRAAHDLVKTLKKSTKDLRKVEDAMKAGYLPEGPCVEVPGLGAMGVHYVNGALVDGVIDPKAPEVLVFMPDDRGRLDLVAVEFLTVGLTQAPSVAGIPFEEGPFPGNHSLHAWIYEKNPSGTFAAFNPNLSCP
ncbi:hypothetical protein [Arthrobacter sp.]|uniref:hypothetical protein n=1 Tax=Arthrobacter sp. TaxID=1667 RepID=UPI002810BF39|nr:hypothetical protein [Arthrobacter sp.]